MGLLQVERISPLVAVILANGPCVMVFPEFAHSCATAEYTEFLSLSLQLLSPTHFCRVLISSVLLQSAEP